MQASILVVDDDVNICELVQLYLEKDGFSVQCAHDGAAALSLFRSASFDLVVLDLMLPKVDGMEVCREIRRQHTTPIIMLTAKGETFDKILGLEMGADDYLVKPFEPKELVARVKAVLRRTQGAPEAEAKTVSYPGLSISLLNYELLLAGVPVPVPAKELELLYHLAAHPNRVYTREQLLEEVWGFDYFGDSRTVDVHVKRLREKLEGHEDGWQLKTVWGVGYKFEVKKLA